MPPKPIRTLRNLTRYRKTQINDRQRESSRLHKILEDTGIKLSCVASDILRKSGRDMLDALVSGTTDPVALADLARGQLRKKIPALEGALVGRFDDEHTVVVGQILAHIEIEERIRPFARQRELLTEAALAATRTRNSYLAAQCQRLRGRRGHSKAITAVDHSILTAAWHMLQTGELYRDRTATTSPARTPMTPPSASSGNSNRSDTTSRSSPGRPPPNGDFASVFLAGFAGRPRRVKMVEDYGVAC